MKRIVFVLIALGILVTHACREDTPYISMSAMESAVWIEVNEFRTDSGKAEVTTNFDTMVEQAKKYSGYLAAGNTDPDGTELSSIWETIYDRWGGENQVAVVSQTIKGSADISVEDIIDPIKENPETAAALLEDVSIGGVGIAYDGDGNAYTTILMMKVD
jgi:hypothetical protein